MKNVVFGLLAAASLFACAAPDDTAASDDAVTVAAPTSRPVTIDFEENWMGCRILMGSFIVLEFEGHDFIAYGADDMTACRARIDEIKGCRTTLQGVLTEERLPTSIKRTIDLENGLLVLTSFEEVP